MTHEHPPVTVTIAVCTFRRDHIAETLASLGRLHVPPGCTVSVVVADNDRQPSARERVEAAAASLPFPVTYVHSPHSNISIARNACLAAARGTWCAFIDDDETATEGWLSALLAAARETGADAVLGPVRALYDGASPDWMADGDFHSTYPVFVKGEIRTGYTCNVLFRLDRARELGLAFDLDRGRTGGEDTAFFSRLSAAGGRIAYAPEAWVMEAVTPDRARFGWLRSRKYRMGQTHGRLMATAPRRGGRPLAVALAAGKAAYCFAASAASLHSPVRWRRSALRGVLHLGVVSGLVGVREIVQYGDGPSREGEADAA